MAFAGAVSSRSKDFVPPMIRGVIRGVTVRTIDGAAKPTSS
ncbi:MAG: hypothetical protein QOH32_3579 [Bradyrhizobium sp.]|jgi:hypothetical protein|nr:hypothetical protein [Bradyrhizobium sp.]